MSVQLCLDTLRRCYCQQRLGHASSEARQRRARPSHLPLCVGKEPFVLIKSDESYIRQRPISSVFVRIHPAQ